MWAILVGLISYFVGSAAAKAIGTYGLIAGAGTILFTIVGLLIVRRLE